MSLRKNRIQIESKWQNIWSENNIFETSNSSLKKRKYILEMFPYPSGKIHVGHLRNYTIGDVVSRFYIANDFAVLHAMGWDSFGLPAENAAMKHQVHPAKWTYENISIMKSQLKKIGLSYDWQRELITCDPEYYKFEQEFFIDLFNKKLAYKKLSPVNWDPIDKTVLSNEQVVDGKGWRSGAKIEKKYLNQWFLKITDYAEELLTSLDKMNGWPEKIRNMQRNWIGKSDGHIIKFKVEGFDKKEIHAFSTRIETIFGASFIAVSHEHDITEILSEEIYKKLQKFQQKLMVYKNEEFYLNTGIKAIHPVTGHLIPIIIASYVLADYATGAVFGCPAHDKRDHKLANFLKLPILQVIDNDDSTNIDIMSQPYETKEGFMINSSFLNGLDITSAKKEINNYLANLNVLEKKHIYKLRDWCISRQRYWGAPIPIIYCPKCGTIAAKKEDLPIKLPQDVSITHSGTVLQDHPSWKYIKCHICQSPAVRETDTFDTFFESSWYYFKFATPNQNYMISQKEEEQWFPVDKYIGGIEHAVIHLLYSRFFTKVLSDLGYIKVREPFLSVIPQGMVLHKTYKDLEDNWIYPNDVKKLDDGSLVHKITNKTVIEGQEEKMSKSKCNVIDLEEGLEKFGADVLRLFVLSDTPIDKELLWSENNITSIEKFLTKLINLVNIVNSHIEFLQKEDDFLENALNSTIKKVTSDIKLLNLNLAIANIRKLVNVIKEYVSKNEKFSISVKKSVFVILQLFNPFIPHITEELWNNLGKNTSLVKEKWPIYEESKIKKDSYILAIQINGRLRAKQEFLDNLDDEEIQKKVFSLDSVKKYIGNRNIKKIIFVKRKIMNLILD
ncbi:MAG: leucine--tRNA ligase [Rickettsia sp.]|nr:leucine--tRNA ligase [Rickettsia sp.]